MIGDSWGVFWFPWPLAIIALVVLFFVTRKDRQGPPPGPWPPQPPTQGVQYGPAAPTAPDQPAPGYTPQPEQWNAPTYPGYTGYTAYPGPEGYGGGTGTEAPVRRQAPRDPRRRGPILFWFTLALIALGIGVLGMLDVAGLAVADPAYPAVAVGITGVMLLVGAFYGRAGGLILLGLLTTVGLAGATAADNWEGTNRHETPDTASEVQNKYDFGAGELTIDLTEVVDVSNLDGRAIDIEGGAGEIEVIVPDGMDVEVDAQVGGPGDISLFGDHSSGIGSDMTRQHDGGPNAPDIRIDAQMGVGSITVKTE